MISGSNLKGNMIHKSLRELTDENIQELVNIFNKFENGENINIPGLAKIINKNELEEHDYSFVPGRYVETLKEEIDKTIIKQEIKELSNELFTLLEEFKNLSPKIEESIKKIMEHQD